MAARYNIYYAGQILEGHDPAVVREKLGKVFKANNSTLDKLFSGKSQLLKRDCDKETALKYKQAMERAGAQPIIKSADAEQESAATAAPAPADTGAQASGAPSAADKIAALAASEDVQYQRSSTAASQAEPQAESQKDYDGDVDPVGADILRGYERAPEAEPVLPDPELSLDEAGARLGAETPQAPPAPSTDHLDMAEVGELIPHLPDDLEALSPDTDGIDLAAEGGDLSDCAPPPAQAPDVDLSAIDMAPTGSDVLEEQYRNGEQPAPPATDHIKLAD